MEILTPHFLAALIVLILSELLPFIKKTAANGVLQALGMMVQSLFQAPRDTDALEQRIAELESALRQASADKSGDH